MHRLCIVIPTRNEAQNIGRLLAQLQAASDSGAEIIVVDGASSDDTLEVVETRAHRVLASAPGRGRQISAGIAASTRPFIWMLHADARVDSQLPQLVVGSLADGGALWGRFDIRIDDPSIVLRLVGAAMNLRTRATGIVTGDHGIFCTRSALDAAGGMPEQPLMEDIELSCRLRRLAWPRRLRERIGTSARRWRRHGVLRTVLSMWRFRLRYFCGASPEQLARDYYGG